MAGGHDVAVFLCFRDSSDETIHSSVAYDNDTFEATDVTSRVTPRVGTRSVVTSHVDVSVRKASESESDDSFVNGSGENNIT